MTRSQIVKTSFITSFMFLYPVFSVESYEDDVTINHLKIYPRVYRNVNVNDSY